MTKEFVKFCENSLNNLKDIKNMTKDIVCGMVYINESLFVLRDDEDYKAYDDLYGKWEDNKNIKSML